MARADATVRFLVSIEEHGKRVGDIERMPYFIAERLCKQGIVEILQADSGFPNRAIQRPMIKGD